MIVAAVNFEDRLVLLSDGRELPIIAMYASGPSEPRLAITSELRTEHRVDDWRDAEILAIPLNLQGDTLLIDVASIGLAKPTDIN